MKTLGSDSARVLGYVVSTWPRLSQTFVLNEICALERRGFRVRIFSTKDPDGEPVHAKVSEVQAGVTYLSVRRRWRTVLQAHFHVFRSRPGRYLRTLLYAISYRQLHIMRCFLQGGYVAEQLRLEPVGHLHAHFATAPARVAMFASDLSATPYSFTGHARDIYVDSRISLLRAQMHKAKAVVTVCEYNRRQLAAISPGLRAKVHCIYNGLDPQEFRFHWPRAGWSGCPIVLTVCRLVAKKGVENLIAAAEILRRSGMPFSVEIIGAGPLREQLESQIRWAGLTEYVRLLGPKPLEAVRAAYERAAIFALPCVMTPDGDRDGIPTVLLEAMLSGLPVVTTPIAGIPELLDTEDVGLLAPPGDPHAFAAAIQRLLLDPALRDRIALAARARCESAFSIHESVGRLTALFQNGGSR